jgi:DNA polymerase III subunit delta
MLRSVSIDREDDASGRRLGGTIAAPAPLTLVVGDEEFLVERAIAAIVEGCRALDAEADVRHLVCAELETGQLAELTSPSLFGERRLLILREFDQLQKEVVDEVAALVADVPDDVTLVLVHKGGPRGKAVLDAATAQRAVRIECARFTKPGERLDFVRAQFRGVGRQISESGARGLLEAVGNDLREIAAACAQLCTDTDGPIDGELVGRYYRGRAEANGFAVSDRAIEGKAGEALEQLRWALAVGTAPVLITSALAQGVRGLAKVANAPRGLGPAELARELAMPPWKIDRVRAQLRGWTPSGVASAIAAIARADEQVKGGGTDSGYALEKAVLAIVAARGPA